MQRTNSDALDLLLAWSGSYVLMDDRIRKAIPNGTKRVSRMSVMINATVGVDTSGLDTARLIERIDAVLKKAGWDVSGTGLKATYTKVRELKSVRRLTP